jgi:hypothetical protein
MYVTMSRALALRPSLQSAACCRLLPALHVSPVGSAMADDAAEDLETTLDAIMELEQVRER